MLSTHQLIVKDLSAFQSLTYRLTKLLPAPLIICLSGSLGTGKTQFVKFFAAKLGITSSVISPTFVKLLRYKFFNGWISHLDAYHLKTPESVAPFLEYLDDEYVLIEWPDLFIPHLKNHEVLYLKITNTDFINSRKIEFKASYKIIESIRQEFT